VFFVLNEYGKGENCLSFTVKCFDNLNAGALRQFTIGGMA
jgi:hypothetical protein